MWLHSKCSSFIHVHSFLFMYVLSWIYIHNAFHDIHYAVNLLTAPEKCNIPGFAPRLGLLGDWAVDRLHKMTQMAPLLNFVSMWATPHVLETTGVLRDVMWLNWNFLFSWCKHLHVGCPLRWACTATGQGTLAMGDWKEPWSSEKCGKSTGQRKSGEPMQIHWNWPLKTKHK